MRGAITNHEEVLSYLVQDFSGVATAKQLASEMVVSVSTIRRYGKGLRDRGWVYPVMGAYVATPEGRTAHQNGEAW